MRSYTVYEVDVVDDPRQSECILENENIVVTLDENKIKLLNWTELKPQKLSSIDWINKGEVDIIRCGKWHIMTPTHLLISPYLHTIHFKNLVDHRRLSELFSWNFIRSYP